MEWRVLIWIPHSSRSAFMNLSYEVSLSHTGPNTLKTNAPNGVIWDVIRAWAYECNPSPASTLHNPSPALTLLSKPRETWTPNINFHIREDANPLSRESGILRYQMNPNKNFGPGIRSTCNLPNIVDIVHKRTEIQKKKKNGSKRKLSTWPFINILSYNKGK